MQALECARDEWTESGNSRLQLGYFLSLTESTTRQNVRREPGSNRGGEPGGQGWAGADNGGPAGGRSAQTLAEDLARRKRPMVGRLAGVLDGQLGEHKVEEPKGRNIYGSDVRLVRAST